MSAIHGAFDGYLHRSLLWYRSSIDTKIKRIRYPKDRTVPSWSWMAYDGRIEYLQADYNRVEWNRGLRLEEDVLKAEIRALQAKKFKTKRFGEVLYYILDGDGATGDRGRLTLDTQNIIDIQALRCVIIGREKAANDEWRYHVLLVLPTCSKGLGTCERVGVGTIPGRFISWHEEGVATEIL